MCAGATADNTMGQQMRTVRADPREPAWRGHHSRGRQGLAVGMSAGLWHRGAGHVLMGWECLCSEGEGCSEKAAARGHGEEKEDPPVSCKSTSRGPGLRQTLGIAACAC